MSQAQNTLIVGSTCSGKTYYLLKSLETEHFREYEWIVLICPTFEYNTSYTEWRYIMDPKFIVLPVPHDRVDDTLKFVSNVYKGTKTAIILDDVASGQDVKIRVSELVNLGMSARHYGLSVFVLTQQLTSISKTFRENIAKLVVFYTPSRKDMQAITNDFLLGVDEDEIREITKNLREHKYARLEINLRHPYSHRVIFPKP